MNSFAPEVKGQAKAFARKKYGKSYVWEPVRWKR